MEEFEVDMGEARIIQGASGNWYIHNAEGYIITEYISWGTEDNRH